MKSPEKIDISLIVAKKTFNHLAVNRMLFVKQPYSVFEIYSPGHSVMIEIYSCEGDVVVEASRNYSLLDDTINPNDQGIVRMEHSNYGGHYVITADNLDGEYYI